MKYYSIIHQIEQNPDLSTLSHKEQNLWEKTIINYIEDQQSNNKYEESSIANIYLLLFFIKTKHIKSDIQIEHQYELIKQSLLEEEKRYNLRIKLTKTEDSKKIVVNQLLYFYKLIEFYISYLEQTLSFFSFGKIAQKVSMDKMYFLQKHQLLQGNIRKFIAYSRLSFSLFLRKYTFLYALLSGIGIVLFWHGIWGISDWIIEKFDTSEKLLSYGITTILGVLILYILGMFLDQTTGDKNNTQDMENMAMEELDELKNIDKALKNKSKKTTRK